MFALSIAYWTFFCVTLVLFFFPALVLWVVTLPFDRKRAVLHHYTTWMAHFYLAANPLWSATVVGNEKLHRNEAAVIVANHASLIDILVLYMLYRPFKWVSKTEIFKLPILGWLLRMNDYIEVERGSRDSVVKMMQTCEAHLKRGVPVLMFPEGTRSQTGTLQAFKDGAFQLARRTGVPVVPVVIEGTGAALPKHGLVMRRRMNARVEVLDPLDPANYDSVDALREATRERMSVALSRAPLRD